MTAFQIASLLITLAALFAFVNHRFIRLPPTIGVMLLALCGSLGLIVAGRMFAGVHEGAVQLVHRIDFHQTVIHGMLAFLLFAGALHLDLADLRREWVVISFLALAGTAISTALLAGLTWGFFHVAGFAAPFVYCLLFGAIISPTDPIAVVGIMKNAGAPKSLETQLAGESLFNDGVGVVIFLTVLGAMAGEFEPSWSTVSLLLLKEVAGGVAIGWAAGLITFYLLRSVDNYQVEVLLTLALAMGGYALADALHASAPIAIVVAGLLIGNRGREMAMSAITRQHLDMFWELLDEIFNAVLFLLVGLVMLVMPLQLKYLWTGLAAVAFTLLARAASVGGVIGALRPWRRVRRGTTIVLTWGGLRGGLSLAMVLAVPRTADHRDLIDLIVFMTYCVVVFSVIVQGLSVGTVIRKVAGDSSPGPGER
jgi:CPA1 family monovalent cation:H+ antiporter